MKTYNEIQEQIEKLEKILTDLLDEQINQAGRYSPLGKNMEKQCAQLQNDISTLKWVLS